MTSPIVNPLVALGLILAVAALLLATGAMIATRHSGKKRLYKRIVWTLIISLAVFIVTRFFLLHLLLDGWYFDHCGTGEGVIAGAPCPETTPAKGLNAPGSIHNH